MKSRYLLRHVVLLLTLNSMVIQGFSYWPFSTNADTPGENRSLFSTLFGSFLPSITWNRSPVFGITAYQHLNLGDPGEVRNDFQFRIGPKPQPTAEDIGNNLENSYISSNEVDTDGIDDSYRRNVKKRFRNLEYQNDVDYLSHSGMSGKSVVINSAVMKNPTAKQMSPRYIISNHEIDDPHKIEKPYKIPLQ